MPMKLEECGKAMSMQEDMEEMKMPEASNTPADSSNTSTGKPSFSSVIALQSTGGYWGVNARDLFARCIDGGQVDDPDVR